MFEDAAMPGPPAPPTPRGPTVLWPTSPRYPYLVARLRNRQITMEEATELFGLLQDALTTAAQAVRPSAPSASMMASGAPAPSTPARPPAPGISFGEDEIGFGLLAMGAGAGLLAALLKRSSQGPGPTGPK